MFIEAPSDRARSNSVSASLVWPASQRVRAFSATMSVFQDLGFGVRDVQRVVVRITGPVLEVCAGLGRGQVAHHVVSHRRLVAEVPPDGAGLLVGPPADLLVGG